MLLTLIIAIPLLACAVLKFLFNKEISYKECGAMAFVTVLVCSFVWVVGRESAAWDHNFINGQVVSKRPWTFSCPTNTSNPCRNGYSCNCYTVCTGTGNNRSYTTHCDTCYRYPWERNWMVSTNVHKGELQISRIDKQGALEPPRWSAIRIGDPASNSQGYRNWVKASASSLFKASERDVERYKNILPNYPEIYDYYKVDRFVTPNLKFENASQWNDAISQILVKLGPSNQLNLLLIVVEGAPRDYAYAVRRHLTGFKKNDGVMVIGLNKGVIEWAEVLSWSKAAIFNVELRNYWEDKRGTYFTSLDPYTTMEEISVISKLFQRRPMKEFEYLRGDILPPVWLIWTTFILMGLLVGGLGYLFYRENPFETYSSTYRRKTYR